MSTTNAQAYLDAQIRSLEEANLLREPVLRTIITALKFTPGSYGLDIGCGIGLQTSLLAEATAPDGRVTGLDISPDLLDYARARIQSSPGADRITLQEGDMRSLPFPDDSFDWAWSADCVGYPAGDLLPVLKEITRVVKPGGAAGVDFAAGVARTSHAGSAAQRLVFSLCALFSGQKPRVVLRARPALVF